MGRGQRRLELERGRLLHGGIVRQAEIHPRYRTKSWTQRPFSTGF